MENTTAQPTPVPPPATPPPPPLKPMAAPVPSIDAKASLKIETAAQTDTEPKVNYGEKLFLLGLVFCVLIVIGTVVIAYFWSQKGNQIQKPITVEQNK